jgi:hypothetical protein
LVFFFGDRPDLCAVVVGVGPEDASPAPAAGTAVLSSPPDPQPTTAIKSEAHVAADTRTRDLGRNPLLSSITCHM